MWSGDEKQYADKNSLLIQIRPCFLYKEEYSDCKSIKGRFHQHFIHGQSIDCESWKKDFDNCVQYEEKKDAEAATAVIKSEERRRHERLRAHYGNGVWLKRPSPPEDWNSPLPVWIEERNKNTYLDIKNREFKGEVVEQVKEKSSFCPIM